MVAVEHGGRPEGRRIRSRSGFGQSEASEELAAGETRHPPFPLLVRAERGEDDLGKARDGDAHRVRGADCGNLLEDHRVLEVAEPEPAVVGVRLDPAEAELAEAADVLGTEPFGLVVFLQGAAEDVHRRVACGGDERFLLFTGGKHAAGNNRGRPARTSPRARARKVPVQSADSAVPCEIVSKLEPTNTRGGNGAFVHGPA